MFPASNSGIGGDIGFPDVCTTPVGPAVVPIPYPNFALNGTALGFQPNILTTMVPQLNMMSREAITNGMQAGVAHPLLMGSGGYTMGNPMVISNGLPSINLLMPTNGNNFNNPLGANLIPSLVNVLFCSLPGAATPDAPASALDAATADAMQALIGDMPDHRLGLIAWPVDTDGVPATTVVHVRRNTLADRIGIRRGDVLLAIDDQQLAGLPGKTLQQLMIAEPGRLVRLTIHRNGCTSPVTLAGMQQPAPRHHVTAAHLPDGVGYIGVGAIGQDLPRAVASAIDRLGELRALVLDLRGNPGGELGAAVRTAGDFLDAGTPVVTVADGDGQATTYRSKSPARHTMPLVVLVDGQTVSAAELLAGALQANGRAVVVGATTWGKGAAQAVLAHESRTATTHLFTLPDGREVLGHGIEPDVAVADASAVTALSAIARLRANARFQSLAATHADAITAELTGAVANDAARAAVGLIAEQLRMKPDTVASELRRAVQTTRELPVSLPDDPRLQAALAEARKLARL